MWPVAAPSPDTPPPAPHVLFELQDVAPLPRGFGGAGFRFGAPPLLRLERAAMIYLGVASSGVHVNGWVRDPADSHKVFLLGHVHNISAPPAASATAGILSREMLVACSLQLAACKL